MRGLQRREAAVQHLAAGLVGALVVGAGDGLDIAALPHRHGDGERIAVRQAGGLQRRRVVVVCVERQVVLRIGRIGAVVGCLGLRIRADDGADQLGVVAIGGRFIGVQDGETEQCPECDDDGDEHGQQRAPFAADYG